jgi:hypothetical protein
MSRVTVAPGLVVDDEMYEAAAHIVREHVPHRADRLTWEFFTTRENWLLYPEAKHPGEPFYKAELIIVDEPPWTELVKASVWQRPENRKWAHGHPWPFWTHVGLGGLVEDRHRIGPGGVVISDLGCIYEAGSVNYMPRSEFHEVVDILVPGRTLTVVVSDQGRKSAWGYLDPATGVHMSSELLPIDSATRQLFLERNPHVRQR